MSPEAVTVISGDTDVTPDTGASGFWEAVVGKTNVLDYMLVWDNRAHREKAWNSFQSDPEWIKARRETEKEGPLVQSVTNMFLGPTSYSSLK